jgi:hypothetical protein
VHRIARRAIKKPVSIASMGRSLEGVPDYKAVLAWFAHPQR